jgi:uroporphyrinogen decarboxylase
MLAHSKRGLIIFTKMDSKKRFLSACRNQVVDHPPVWIMRQAGRALPEYLALRRKYSFSQIIHSPEQAAIATLQPVRRFKMDAAIIFSDILVVPAAMGMKVSFNPEVAVSPRLATRQDIDRLKIPEAEKALGFVARVIKNVRAEVGDSIAVLGFSGAPFTLATYMIEGGSSRNFARTKTLICEQPKLFEKLLNKIAQTVTDYLELQILADADAVQLFDTWAGELAPEEFQRFVLPVVQEIIRKLDRRGAPIIYYINGMGNLLALAQKTGADVLSVDWRINLSQVRERLGAGQAVQGNLDPAILLAPEKVIKRAVFEMLDQTSGRGHIVNLGHGLLPQTPLRGIQAFVDAARKWKKGKR